MKALEVDQLLTEVDRLRVALRAVQMEREALKAALTAEKMRSSESRAEADRWREAYYSLAQP